MTPAVAYTPHGYVESSIELLLKAQSGDDTALNRLLARYLPRLRRWASGRLPAGARAVLDTGDLVQDSMISALPHLSSFEVRHPGSFLAYMRRVIGNRILDLHREATRRPFQAELPDNVPCLGTSPLDAVIRAEKLRSYEQALASLDENDRQAIVLRIEVGLGYSEIAARLGKPSSEAARMAVTRAVARLARRMRSNTARRETSQAA